MPTATAPHPLFAACIEGIDIGRPFDIAWIGDALDRWSVPVFPYQTITDDSQIAFGAIFAPSETPRSRCERSRTVIDNPMTLATNPDLIYSHRWQQGDVVLWDNHAATHCAILFASAPERRYMAGTTASCSRSI